jgi:hypothetical protein
VKKYGQTIDVIENSGLTSTAVATCLYSKPVSGDVLAGGFETAKNQNVKKIKSCFH